MCLGTMQGQWQGTRDKKSETSGVRNKQIGITLKLRNKGLKTDVKGQKFREKSLETSV